MFEVPSDVLRRSSDQVQDPLLVLFEACFGLTLVQQSWKWTMASKEDSVPVQRSGFALPCLLDFVGGRVSQKKPPGNVMDLRGQVD